MAVYGYGKMHAQLVAQGWDPAEVGRDRVCVLASWRPLCERCFSAV